MEKVKRTAIIDSVIQVVAERGFHGASMAMISERAVVATGTIYRYFESKEVLITDIYWELENRICKALLQNYKSKDTIRQRYIHLGRGLLSYIIDNPLHFRYLEQFRNSPYGVALRTG
ncbi:MAG TPA: TetR/AcrR family transcriptional regulator, partial [Geobacteraceae bacterium]|nr:TetR/AcrR family transcriptional regulator [Geobacteraceae bacterium]